VAFQTILYQTVRVETFACKALSCYCEGVAGDFDAGRGEILLLRSRWLYVLGPKPKERITSPSSNRGGLLFDQIIIQWGKERC